MRTEPVQRPQSWVASANERGCDFPLENLPFCAFRVAGMDTHLGVGIGDQVLDLNLLSRTGLLRSVPWKLRSVCRSGHLNALMGCGGGLQRRLRQVLTELLAEGTDARQRDEVTGCLRPMAETRFELPVKIGNYTDFYASVQHATNVGKLFRPDKPLLPNYKWVPIGYHGRASSIVVSGTPVRRPCGQRKPAGAAVPEFGATRQLDYEVELGAYVGFGNVLGVPIRVEDASERIFGVSLVNDWSARDVQAWEYQPLGPFLGKSFATSVSPWVVTMEALAPYRVAMAPRPEGDPEPLPYLAHAGANALDVTLEVWIQSERMRQEGKAPMRISSANARGLYWSFPQMVAHHTSNGCNLETGDLLASGTVSGAAEGTEGCLLERTRGGVQVLRLPSGEERTFLEDGDEVTLRGFCEREGLSRIGLGECKGRVLPASLSSRSSGEGSWCC